VKSFNDKLPVEAEVDDHPAKDKSDNLLDIFIMPENPNGIIINLIAFLAVTLSKLLTNFLLFLESQ
jgi:hypothetical protein